VFSKEAGKPNAIWRNEKQRSAAAFIFFPLDTTGKEQRTETQKFPFDIEVAL
jgi:hypothetical protein